MPDERQITYNSRSAPKMIMYQGQLHYIFEEPPPRTLMGYTIIHDEAEGYMAQALSYAILNYSDGTEERVPYPDYKYKVHGRLPEAKLPVEPQETDHDSGLKLED